MKRLLSICLLLLPFVLPAQSVPVEATSAEPPRIPMAGFEEGRGGCLLLDTVTTYFDRSTQFYVLNAGSSGFVFGTGSVTSQTAVHYDAPAGLARVDGALIFFTDKVLMGPADSLPIYVYAAGTDSMPTTLLGTGKVSVADIDTSGPATYVPIPNCATFTGQFLISVNYGAINDTVNIISNNVLTTNNGPDGNGEKRTRQFRNSTWQRAWDIWTINQAPLDADAIVMPIVCLIQCSGPPNAAYSDSVSSLSVSFTDQSTGDQPAGWIWDFGDGNTSSLQNPSHTYAAPGSYTVCLIASNACGSDTTCSTVTVSCAAPSANFSFVDNGLGNMDFNDLSTSGANITGWLWDFGDGFTSTAQNPNHQYPAPGTYLVCLTVTDVCGTDSTCQSVTLLPCTPPSASFTAVPGSNGNASFSSTSSVTGTAQYAWTFGDGNTGAGATVNHVYAGNGTYQVCLTVIDSCSTDSSCQSITITSVGLENSFVESLEVYPNPSNADFTVSGTLQNYGAVEIALFDAMGKQVYTAEENGIQLGIQHRVRTNGLANGVYYLHLQQGEQRIVHKVMLR